MFSPSPHLRDDWPRVDDFTLNGKSLTHTSSGRTNCNSEHSALSGFDLAKMS